MRSLPTRRNVIFGIAFLISFVLFVQIGLGPYATFQIIGYDDASEETVLSTPNSERPLHTLKTNNNARRPILEWGSEKVPTTEILMHAPGWTVFDRLYLFNGTLFIVTNEPKNIPDRSLMISPGNPIIEGPDGVAMRMSTDKDMQIILPETAASIFGSSASIIDGPSFVMNDPPQFTRHYYHWSAEIFFGLWRAYSSLDPNITADGYTKLASPRRILMGHVPYDEWRDYASMNQWVTRGAFPSISLEFSEDWEDRASMAQPFVFERAVLADRAASTHDPSFVMMQRFTAPLFDLAVSPYWWTTIRNNLVEFSGAESDDPNAKVITYVSRQDWGRRMLLPNDHRRLVAALKTLEEQYGYEVNIVSMDKLTRQEQFRLASRTTIMMGVHGNGLTSLLWMKVTPRTTVMEFFYPGGFAHDYEWTARALGIKHYGFWGSDYFTSPDLPPMNYPEGFQGKEIPIDGAAVARLCHERLSSPEGQ